MKTKTYDHERANTYNGAGIHITTHNRQDGLLSQQDFYDTSTAKLSVELAGGACNLHLGKANVKVSLENCDEDIYHQVFIQNDVHQEFDVPAHVIYARIVSLQHSTEGDRQFVMDTIAKDSHRVDLSLVEEKAQVNCLLREMINFHFFLLFLNVEIK